MALLTDDLLEFREEDHKYFYDGIPAPSVTQIIGEWIKIKIHRRYYYVSTWNGVVVDADIFEAAGDFGTAIHLGAKFLLGGDLDWNALDHSLIAPLKQIEKWSHDYEIKPLVIEHPMYSRKYGYAGTPDIICMVIKGTICLIDIKTGFYELAGPQTAAYEQLYRELYKCRKRIERYVLHVPRDGSDYTFKPITGRKDWQYFKNKLYEYKNRALISMN